jgi:hypothetical protein
MWQKAGVRKLREIKNTCVCVCVCVCNIRKLYNGESNFYHRSNPGLINRYPQAEKEKELNSIIIIIIVIITIIIIIAGRDN